MIINICPKCGCYIPDNFDTCPNCNWSENNIGVEKASSTVKNDLPLLSDIYFSKESLGYYPDYVSSSWNEKVYNKLKYAILLFIQNDKDFKFWRCDALKKIPAFSDIGVVAIDDMLFCLAEEGKIERYSRDVGWQWHYYRRLPQNKYEKRNRKKFLKRGRLVFRYIS